MEPDGYLVVTDRKKDIIVTTNGENLSPRRIESLLVLEPEISQAIAIGDHKPYVAALIVPDPELAADWASRHDKPGDPALLIEDAEFRRMVATAVERANACLSATERIRRFALLAEPFTIENGLLTPTLKVRRQLVTRTHEAVVSSLYRDAAA
jgi:long-chain acyl-CoA synthetase